MAERPTRRNVAREILEGSACAWAASPEVRPIGVRTTAVRAARAATEEGQCEYRADVAQVSRRMFEADVEADVLDTLSVLAIINA